MNESKPCIIALPEVERTAQAIASGGPPLIAQLKNSLYGEYILRDARVMVDRGHGHYVYQGMPKDMICDSLWTYTKTQKVIPDGKPAFSKIYVRDGKVAIAYDGVTGYLRPPITEKELNNE